MRTLEPNPIPYVGGYTLDLYCKYDHGHEPARSTFMGETFDACAQQARQRGWIIHRDGLATCPGHAKGTR